MATAHIASTGIVLEALTRDNYLNWSVLVKNYLMGKRLWHNIVEGDLKTKDRSWEFKNRQALHAIQLSCGYQTLSQIRKCETAKEAWNHLKAAFSEDLKAENDDIEKGHLHDVFGQLQIAVRKGLWDEAKSIIGSGGDVIFQQSSSNGWTVLHVAVDAGQEKIVEELVKIEPSLLTEKDWEGYTPLALAAVTDDKKIAKWMISEGGDDLLYMKIKADDDKGDIPVLLAAAKGHKQMTRSLFSNNKWSSLLDNNCHYGARLLSLCIQAEIFGKS